MGFPKLLNPKANKDLFSMYNLDPFRWKVVFFFL